MIMYIDDIIFWSILSLAVCVVEYFSSGCLFSQHFDFLNFLQGSNSLVILANWQKWIQYASRNSLHWHAIHKRSRSHLQVCKQSTIQIGLAQHLISQDVITHCIIHFIISGRLHCNVSKHMRTKVAIKLLHSKCVHTR